MSMLEVTHISKSFGNKQAVDDVSFEVRCGEIFGLLGPNGAGKTTTIRILLDIFKADQGSISLWGGAMNEEKKRLIGYMPEERGLYQDIPVERCLLYLASLKGMPEREARSRLHEYLDHFDLLEYKGKKVKELSKGMQQKAQMICTILHQPKLIVVDEPFAGLDPVNVQLVRETLNELRRQGVTIIMSTHQMQQVEEMCDRILLIHHGRSVLYGSLEEVRKRFTGHEVLVRSSGDLSRISGVRQIQAHNTASKLTLADDTSPEAILHSLIAMKYPVEKFEIATPSLTEIFIQVVGEGNPG
jgi:ABC-2 type transport system ATP-binding protein